MAMASSIDSNSARHVVRGICSHDCPDSCVWQVTVENGVAVSLRGDAGHPTTRGGLCAKVNPFLERVYSADRVLYPLRRIGPKGEGRFERVSWDDALADIASRLKERIAKHGPTTVLPYSFAGSQGLLQFASLDRRFFSLLGASRLVRGLCGDTASAGIAATQGNAWGIDPEDLRHSRFIVLWGTNTIVTNLHLWRTIQQARAQGAKIVVVDPLRTRTAEAADWHLRPLPGTDTALVLGVMHVIVAENLHDTDYIERYTVGFDQLKERISDYPPERVAAITGLGVDEIVSFARAYATTRPSAIRLLVGLEHHEHGAMMFRTVACLPALIGAWRDLGGGLTRSMFAYWNEALNLDALIRPDLEDSSIRSFNMARLGETLTDPKIDPPVTALIVYNCNPATITPNQDCVLDGLRREDLLTIVLEQFVTDTARYADYVFPATTEIEHLDLVPSWGFLHMGLNRPAISPRGEAVPNTEFFRRLARQMGMTEPCLFDSDEQIIRDTLASRHPWLAGIDYDYLEREGWARLRLPANWRPFAEGGFPTRSGKLEFFSEELAQNGFDPLPVYAPSRESAAGDPQLASKYPLMLITTKSLHFLNASYVNMPRQRYSEREPLVEIHPDDAEARNIASGDFVRVFNDRGDFALRGVISDRVRPGVVTIPFAWWSSLTPRGGGANLLTNDIVSDWGGGGGFHDTLVQVALAPRP
jgi:anaerobic selenocysteine-containing dehydrogenase